MIPITSKVKSTSLLRLALYSIGAVIFLFSTLALPLLAGSASLENPEYAFLRWPVTLGIWATLIPFFMAFVYAHKLLQQIDCQDPFSEQSLKALLGIYSCAIAISLMYGVGMIFLFVFNALHPGILIMGVSLLLVSICIALFSQILYTLFNQALALKNEQEFTI